MNKHSACNGAIAAKQIIGAAGTGKTEAIVSQIASLVNEGVRSKDIAVFVPSPQAAYEMERRISQAFTDRPSAIKDLCISTPRKFSLSILGTDEAFRITGRKARILSPLEEAMLFEDLKVGGLNPGRIRAIVSYFSRCWTELADDDPNWLQGAEEYELHALLQENLSFVEAILESQASNFARKVLLQAELNSAFGAGRTFGFDHVFVDDYQRISRASQHLCCLAARKAITITADPCACAFESESYPYARGVQEFVEMFPDAIAQKLSASHKSRSLCECLSAFGKNEGLEPCGPIWAGGHGEGAVSTLVFGSPEEELSGVAELIKKSLSEDPGQDVIVAVPHAKWIRPLAGVLQDNGIEVEYRADSGMRNARFATVCEGLPSRLLCALRLVADPSDCPAWRSWCGFGDPMAFSAAVKGARQAAKEAGLSFGEAMSAFAAGRLTLPKGSLGSAHIAEVYRRGIGMCERAENLRGMELLQYLSRCVQPEGELAIPHELLEACRDGASAFDLLQKAEQMFESPVPHGDGKIAILTYQEALGASADTLVIAGFVNGFVPKSDWFDLTKTPASKQAPLREKDARFVAALAGVPQRSMVLTAFSEIGLEEAARLKLKVDRIRMKNGTRMASVSPSIFLDSLIGSSC